MGVGGLQGVNAGLLPFVGLPADLGEGGLAAGPLLLGLLHAPAGEGEDDLRGQGQKVKEGVENLRSAGERTFPSICSTAGTRALKPPSFWKAWAMSWVV